MGSFSKILARFWPPEARSCRCQRQSGIVAPSPEREKVGGIYLKPSPRAMIILWISDVPSTISHNRASR
jgi:hypothetical protein